MVDRELIRFLYQVKGRVDHIIGCLELVQDGKEIPPLLESMTKVARAADKLLEERIQLLSVLPEA